MNVLRKVAPPAHPPSEDGGPLLSSGSARLLHVQVPSIIIQSEGIYVRFFLLELATASAFS